ncbi:uncharacterized protein BP5553_10007 [Venustampulla echinocandica]|uniref:Uncharacterized protein n=1 Tax=Venustampulla echinocandica TaxID=2656787 RepID=A0A370TA43_9HELO|nr:uncharacterized protein BP5553_10007 [Venustampulla echinocandica]RDL30662.1 hypothetical protein BP5553_10007 [Venustampulla echinocandica]
MGDAEDVNGSSGDGTINETAPSPPETFKLIHEFTPYFVTAMTINGKTYGGINEATLAGNDSSIAPVARLNPHYGAKNLLGKLVVKVVAARYQDPVTLKPAELSNPHGFSHHQIYLNMSPMGMSEIEIVHVTKESLPQGFQKPAGFDIDKFNAEKFSFVHLQIDPAYLQWLELQFRS